MSATASLKADTKPPEPVKPAAVDSSAALPSSESLMEKYLAAIGGKASALKVNSRLYKGVMEMPAMGLKGAVLVYAKAPNKTLTSMEIAGLGKIEQGYNGKVGWSQDPLTGIRELKDAELAMMKRLVEFHRDVNLKETYSKMTVKGKSKVGTSEAYHVEAVTPEGTTEQLYFDTKDSLLLRSDFEFESPQGKMMIETYWEDYRIVDGIKMAFQMRQQTAAFTIITRIEEVKHNVAIEDSKFDKPKPPQ